MRKTRGGRHRPLSQVVPVLFSLCSFPLYYLRAWHRLRCQCLMITILWWAMKRWVTLTTFDQTDKRDICRGSTLGWMSVGHAEHRSLDRLDLKIFLFQRFLAFLWTETKMKNWRSVFCGQEEFFSRYSERARWAQLGQPIRIQDSLYFGGNVTYPLWTKGQTSVRSHHNP